MRATNAARSALLAALVVLAGCTIQLSPRYDARLVEGLNGANVQAMTLFSALNGGAEASTFHEHEDAYNALLGVLGALRIQAGSRPVPALSQNAWEALSGFERFVSVCPDAQACTNPTPKALEEAIDEIETMKDVHEDRGLGSDVVPLYLDNYTSFLEMAVAFETFLADE